MLRTKLDNHSKAEFFIVHSQLKQNYFSLARIKILSWWVNVRSLGRMFELRAHIPKLPFLAALLSALIVWAGRSRPLLIPLQSRNRPSTHSDYNKGIQILAKFFREISKYLGKILFVQYNITYKNPSRLKISRTLTKKLSIFTKFRQIKHIEYLGSAESVFVAAGIGFLAPLPVLHYGGPKRSLISAE